MIGRLIVRAFYCAVPASIAGVAAGVTNLPAGVIAFACFFAFGWEVTTPRPDRGERP